MKCLVDARFNPALGGSSGYSRSLVQALIKLGTDVDFYLLVNREGDYEKRENIKKVFVLEELINGFGRYLTAVLQASRVVGKISRETAPDVIFCPSQIKLPLLSMRPVATVVYDLQHYIHPEFFSLAEHIRRRLFIGNSIRSSRFIFTISSFSAECIKKVYGRSAKVIYAGIDESFLPPPVDIDSCRTVLSKFNISRPFILYPANNWRHKNHHTLLEALSILKKRGRLDFKTVLTGTLYPGCYDIPNETKRLGLGEVTHIGYVEQMELKALYQNADLVVFPSLLEGFGMPALEAMASGAPVIASSAASLPEVTGGAAALIDPLSPDLWADTIGRFMRDDKLKCGLRDAGYRNVKRFSWENTARLVLEELRNMRRT